MKNKEYYSAAIYLAHKFKSDGHYALNFDDLKSEAMIMAEKVIKKFDAKKGAKLKTFVHHCVENRLKTLRRDHRNEPITIELDDFGCDIADRNDSIGNLELDLSLRQLLTPKEYELYMLVFLMGHNLREVAKMNKFGKYTEVRQCYIRILRKYRAAELQ